MSVWVIVILPTVSYEKKLKEDNKLTVNQDRAEKGISFSKKEGAMRTISEETFMTEVLEKALEELFITNAVWIETKNKKFYQVYFDCDVEESDGIIQFLHGKGLGRKTETFIGMVPLSLFYRNDMEIVDTEEESDSGGEKTHNKTELTKKISSFRNMQEKFLKSVTARLTVAQVVASVQSGAELTFDFVCYIVFAAWIAAMGLLDNSVVNTVASMLVSPLMGPVMAMTFGTIIRDRTLRNMGIRNACIGFSITILFGYLFGLLVLNFTREWNPDALWPTDEMKSRGVLRVLWVGMLVALPSGAAVAVSLLSGNQSSLVGVAISASLLPPCVNSGLLWSFATLKALRSITQTAPMTVFENNTYMSLKPALKAMPGYRTVYFDNMIYECAMLGLVSLLLAVVNVICIFLMAFVVLKVKEVAPLSKISPPTHRFWKEDIKIARDRNRAHAGHAEDIGGEILEEWAQITGIDPKELLSDDPEARMRQIQTLRDLLEDAADDEVLRSIMRTTHGTEMTDIMKQVNQASLNRRRSSTRAPYWNLWEGDQGTRRATVNTVPASLGVKTSTLPTSRRTSGATSLKSSSEDVSMKNIKPDHELHKRRRSSALLRQSLQQSDHSPHSLWPHTRGRSGSRFQVTPVTDPASIRTRRASRLPRLSATFEGVTDKLE